ncbi:MAG: RNA recognition motif domain-containing protein [bacterium]
MGKKLYVGNMSFEVTEEALREVFAAVGAVASAKIITDAATGRSKGFGFVEMESEEDAAKAISDLNGKTIKDRAIVVSEARPQQPKDRGGFGGKGGFRRGPRDSFGGGRGPGQGRGR